MKCGGSGPSKLRHGRMPVLIQHVSAIIGVIELLRLDAGKKTTRPPHLHARMKNMTYVMVLKACITARYS